MAGDAEGELVVRVSYVDVPLSGKPDLELLDEAAGVVEDLFFGSGEWRTAQIEKQAEPPDRLFAVPNRRDDRGRGREACRVDAHLVQGVVGELRHGRVGVLVEFVFHPQTPGGEWMGALVGPSVAPAAVVETRVVTVAPDDLVGFERLSDEGEDIGHGLVGVSVGTGVGQESVTDQDPQRVQSPLLLDRSAVSEPEQEVVDDDAEPSPGLVESVVEGMVTGQEGQGAGDQCRSTAERSAGDDGAVAGSRKGRGLPDRRVGRPVVFPVDGQEVPRFRARCESVDGGARQLHERAVLGASGEHDPLDAEEGSDRVEMRFECPALLEGLDCSEALAAPGEQGRRRMRLAEVGMVAVAVAVGDGG